MFSKIVIGMIFVITALVIFGIVQLGVDKSVDKICNDYAKNSLQCIESTR